MKSVDEKKYLRSLYELSDEQVVHNTHISF